MGFNYGWMVVEGLDGSEPQNIERGGKNNKASTTSDSEIVIPCSLFIIGLPGIGAISPLS